MLNFSSPYGEQRTFSFRLGGIYHHGHNDKHLVKIREWSWSQQCPMLKSIQPGSLKASSLFDLLEVCSAVPVTTPDNDITVPYSTPDITAPRWQIKTTRCQEKHDFQVVKLVFKYAELSIWNNTLWFKFIHHSLGKNILICFTWLNKGKQKEEASFTRCLSQEGVKILLIFF